MLPTINLTGNFVLGERLSTRLGKVHNGDVVFIRSPTNPRKVIIKRVIGLEGDSVNYVPSDHKEATIVVKNILLICWLLIAFFPFFFRTGLLGHFSVAVGFCLSRYGKILLYEKLGLAVSFGEVVLLYLIWNIYK